MNDREKMANALMSKNSWMNKPIFTMDPEVDRLNVLPYPKGAISGEPVQWDNWVAPQWTYDMVDALMYPGRVMSGDEGLNQEKITNTALTLGGFGGSIAGKIMPTGAAGMWYNSIPAPSWSKADMVDILMNPTKKELGQFIKENGPLRAAKDHSNGDIYVWPGEAALHNDVIGTLPQNGMVDSIPSTIWDWSDYARHK